MILEFLNKLAVSQFKNIDEESMEIEIEIKKFKVPYLDIFN